jgi:ketosteroid isomerase-like protein
MAPADKLTLLKKLFHDFATTGDVTHILDHCTDDAVYRLTVGPGTPLSGDWVGKPAIARYFEVMNATVRHDGFNVHDFFASPDDPDKLAVSGDETLTIHRNGVTFFTDWVLLFTFRGDKVSRFVVVENLGPLEAAYADPQPAA